MEEKRLYRSNDDKMIAGVCGGLGKYFSIDTTIVRLVFVVLMLLGGPGLLLYIILWIITPQEIGADGYSPPAEISSAEADEEA